ncbi:MAG TPA: sugar transferase [Oligoflexia bacterium]|nr:sugar transferase [Oligoflexia bacterium]
MVNRIPPRLRPYYAFLITLAQTVADLSAVAVSFWFGYYVYIGSGAPAPQTPSEYWLIVAMAVGCYFLIFRILNLYEREISLLNVEELKKIFMATIWASFLFFGLAFYIRSVSLSRIMITVSIVTAGLLVYLERILFYRLHIWFHENGFSRENVLVYGAGYVGKHLVKRLSSSPGLGYLPIGFMDDDSQRFGQIVTFKDGGPRHGLLVFGGLDDLERVVKENQVREVFIAMPNATYERNLEIINKCRALGVSFSIVPNAYQQFVQKISATEIGGIPLLRNKSRKDTLGYLVAKRVLDFFISSLLIVALSPLLMVFSILIKIDSRGPVIFKQKRVGLRGKEFSFYKFRTMRVDAPKYALTPQSTDDPRITRVGRWLRRTSLDELPQLFNVFRGDMSLVGPRPEMPFIVEKYDELQRERLSVKPGITGVWQISCVRGEPIHENVEYDLFYIEHRSMLLDIAILLKTIAGVVRGIGAV